MHITSKELDFETERCFWHVALCNFTVILFLNMLHTYFALCVLSQKQCWHYLKCQRVLITDELPLAPVHTPWSFFSSFRKSQSGWVHNNNSEIPRNWLGILQVPRKQRLCSTQHSVGHVNTSTYLFWFLRLPWLDLSKMRIRRLSKRVGWGDWQVWITLCQFLCSPHWLWTWNPTLVSQVQNLPLCTHPAPSFEIYRLSTL